GDSAAVDGLREAGLKGVLVGQEGEDGDEEDRGAVVKFEASSSRQDAEIPRRRIIDAARRVSHPVRLRGNGRGRPKLAGTAKTQYQPGRVNAILLVEGIVEIARWRIKSYEIRYSTRGIGG